MGKRNDWLKLVAIIAGCILLIFTVFIMYGISLLSKINFEEEEPVTIPEEVVGIPEEAPKQKETKIVNVLLLGIDRQSPNERGRSDTIMIASIDKGNTVVKLTSLMRDMYVPIPGRDNNRINAAYAFGGPSLAIKTVNQNFNMNIKHYIALDFWGFEEIVDLMGGVEVELTAAESRIVGVRGAGIHFLSGNQALSYARIRRIGSDFQRTERQRTILNEIFQSAMNTRIIDIPKLLAAGLPHMETNMSKLELLSLGKDVLSFDSRGVEEYRLPADKTYTHERIRGMAVLVPDIEKNTELLHEFIFN